jgi:hypothetical protein
MVATQHNPRVSETLANASSRCHYHDRAWWRAEARRLGSDWPGIEQLHWEVVAALRARHGRDSEARRDGAPQSAVDALVYELRTQGASAIQRPDCRQRLAAISTAQLRAVMAELIRLRPKYPNITDDLLLTLGEQL